MTACGHRFAAIDPVTKAKTALFALRTLCIQVLNDFRAFIKDKNSNGCVALYSPLSILNIVRSNNLYRDGKTRVDLTVA